MIYPKRVAVLNQELKSLNEKLSALNDNSVDEVHIRVKAICNISEVLEKYWTLSPKEKNDSLKSIVDKIEYMKTERNSRHKPDEIKFKLKTYIKF